MDTGASVAAIQDFWSKLRIAPFPGVTGDEELKFKLTTVDTFAAGCVQTFIDCNGRLDPERTLVLKGCVSDLELCTRDLNGEAREYFDRLLTLSRLVLFMSARGCD